MGLSPVIAVSWLESSPPLDVVNVDDRWIFSSLRSAILATSFIKLRKVVHRAAADFIRQLKICEYVNTSQFKRP